MVGRAGAAFEAEGLNEDVVYEDFIQQIAGDRLKADVSEEGLKESVERDKKRREIEKQIAALQAKMRKFKKA